MGDFASPAVGPNGSICINNSMNPASGSVVPAGAVGIPKHSTVVERLRQRIEGCRRHHTICENRYQQAHSEQLELGRRDTVNLYQRTLEQRAKKSVGGGGSKQPQIKQQQQDPDSASSTEQRNNTLIAVRTSACSQCNSVKCCTRCLIYSASLCPFRIPTNNLQRCNLFHECKLVDMLTERRELLPKRTVYFFKTELHQFTQQHQLLLVGR